MRTLGSALAPSGFLFVGPAEAFLASCSGFASVNQAMSFAFRRTGTKRVESANDSFRRPMKPVKRPDRPRTRLTVKADRAPVPVPLVLKAPVAPPSELALARGLADAGRLEEAAAGCERHLQQRGPSSEAYYLLGLLRDATGDGPGAAESYRRVVYLEPEHVEALMHLALCMENQGDAAAAERFRNRARRVEHNAKTKNLVTPYVANRVDSTALLFPSCWTGKSQRTLSANGRRRLLRPRVSSRWEPCRS